MLIIFSILFISQGLLFAQDINSNTELNGTEIASNNSAIDESTILLNTNQNSNNNQTDTNTTNTVWLFARMILVLAIVIACIYVVIRLLKKGMGIKVGDDDYLKNVSTISLGQGKSVNVVTLGKDAYIVGVTDTNINLLGKVEDEQLVNAMNLNADQQKAASGKVKDFASILSSFLPTKNRSTKTEEINEEINIDNTDFLKQQRERLRGIDNNGEEK